MKTLKFWGLMLLVLTVASCSKDDNDDDKNGNNNPPASEYFVKVGSNDTTYLDKTFFLIANLPQKPHKAAYRF